MIEFEIVVPRYGHGLNGSEIVLPKSGDEPPLRKQKVENSSCNSPVNDYRSVEYDSWDDDDIGSEEEEEYERQYWEQVVESNGFDVGVFPLPHVSIYPYPVLDKYDYPLEIGLLGRLGIQCYNFQKGSNLELVGINKHNSQMCGRYVEYITLEAVDTSNNSPCDFQTCVCKFIAPEEASLCVQTEICRLKVPAGSRDTTFQRLWEDGKIDSFYKGKLPSWLTKDKLDASSNKGQFYELQPSDLKENEWLQLYADFAFHLKWTGLGNKLKSYLPLELKKVIIQTKETGEELPRMKLKANNAIFYMSFKGNKGDPSGRLVEYQAVVRRTMDGVPGHIRLEVDCVAYLSN